MFDWSGIMDGAIGSVIGGVILALIALVAKVWRFPKRVLTYLHDVYDRKRLGRPYVWWECIGGRMWNLATGKMTLEDAGDIPQWLDKGILKRGNTMIANGRPPFFDIKTQDDEYIYWVVCTAPYGQSPVLAYYRRPRLIR